MQELKRLEAMPGRRAEATVSRNYIEWLVVRALEEVSQGDQGHRAAPSRSSTRTTSAWRRSRSASSSSSRCASSSSSPRASILCFVGPPGVGKTSLAKSIARATGRKFVRLSLGGVRDEAEIRGHRRTYIGAFPGQIIQRMKKAGTVNPVFLLDEVDKMSMDFRGDPSAALLEVLDPEQNNAFVDHYLDVEYDLSKVMFIATANVTHTIPAPLKDRMEIIPLSGYTHQREAGHRPAVPGAEAEARSRASTDAKISFEDEALEELIESYTREAGVRNLEREVGSVLPQDRAPGGASRVRSSRSSSIAPKVARAPRQGEVPLAPDRKNERRDRPRHRPGLDRSRRRDPGRPKSALSRGKGKLTLTGKLGDVMQESARAALSYVRSRAELFGLDPDFHATLDIHIHVPEGAIPEGRPVGRHHHGHGAALGGDQDPGRIATSP